MTEYDITSDGLRCSFDAHLDTASCKDIELRLAEHLNAKPASVTFDMSNVEYISSAFLRICIMTAKKITKGSFQIVSVAPAVKKVFKMAKLDDILNVQA